MGKAMGKEPIAVCPKTKGTQDMNANEAVKAAIQSFARPEPPYNYIEEMSNLRTARRVTETTVRIWRTK